MEKSAGSLGCGFFSFSLRIRLMLLSLCALPEGDSQILAFVIYSFFSHQTCCWHVGFSCGTHPKLHPEKLGENPQMLLPKDSEPATQNLQTLRWCFLGMFKHILQGLKQHVGPIWPCLRLTFRNSGENHLGCGSNDPILRVSSYYQSPRFLIDGGGNSRFAFKSQLFIMLWFVWTYQTISFRWF